MKNASTPIVPQKRFLRKAKLTKNIFTISLLLTTCTLFYTNSQANQSTDHDTTADTVLVYICTGPRAYAYHADRQCKFLNRCGSRIDTLNRQQALKLHRKPCKGCIERTGRSVTQ